PAIAQIVVPSPSPTKANFATPLGVSNAFPAPAQRVVRWPATAAPRASPAAIANAIGIEPGAVALATSAPTKMAGQTRTPLTRTAPRAKPVAGSTGGPLGC